MKPHQPAIKHSFYLALCCVLALTACGGNGQPSGSTGSSTSTSNTSGSSNNTSGSTSNTPTVNLVAISTSSTSIKTDNSDSATLTATVTDNANGLLSGVSVNFATNSGNLSATTAVTNSSGQATVTLSSGASDYSNRTAQVTASVGSKTSSIPVLITGSTLSLNGNTTTIQLGSGSLSFNAQTKDAAGIGKYNQTVRFSLDNNKASLSASNLNTDVQGQTSNINLTPSAAGNIILKAEWLTSSGEVTSTATREITITSADAINFAFTAPSTEPSSLSTGGTDTFTLSVPTVINNKTVTQLRLSTTAGSWTSNNSGMLTLAPSANSASADFKAPSNSGTITIQADALDSNNRVLSSLTRHVAVSAPATAASSLDLQASVSTIPPSSGSNNSSTTLTAMVRDANGNSVGNAPVAFELLGTTGSGESVSPAVVYTDSNGKASATFTAGSISTSGPIYAQARVVDQVCTGKPPYQAVSDRESNTRCDNVSLIVAASAVSVSLGFGTTVKNDADDTQYVIPASVLVVDANGSAVSNAQVTLSAFPKRYRNGRISVDNEGKCVSPTTTLVASEDINRNGVLDSGEDLVMPANGYFDSDETDSNSNGQLDADEDKTHSANGVLSPPQAAAGALSATTVTTDSAGSATFSLRYPKSSGWFIETEVTARVMVSGSERSASIVKVLPVLTTDTESPCALVNEARF